MKVLPRLRLLAMAVAAVCPLLVVGLANATTAEAGSCPSNTFCLWHDSNGNGSMQPVTTLNTVNMTDVGFNDVASSLHNNLNTTICVFIDIDRGGPELAVGPGHHFSNLSFDIASDGKSWNDRISSTGACK